MTVRISQRARALSASATVSITQRAIEMRESGRDVLALSAGEPDFDTPDAIKEAAIEAIRRGETKYTAVDGTSALKRAIAAKFRRDNGLEFSLDQLIVTSGAKQACFNVCQALLDPGDEALIPSPYWVSYPDMVRLADAAPVIVRTDHAYGFVPTAQQIEAAITDQTRLLILNSPNNPTGAVYPRQVLEEIAAVLVDHPRICVLSDDIYEHIRWTDEPFVTLAAVAPQIADRIVTVNGLSKSHAMSGWRIGYAAGDSGLIRALVRLQSQSTTNASSISQAAACAALEAGPKLVADMVKEFRRRHEFVYAALCEIPGVRCEPGQGAFYLLPDVSNAMARLRIQNDVEFCRTLLEAEGLALVPGSAFGAADHVRISFAASQATLESALQRIRRFVTNPPN
jgi:aspartate aminotransferase